MSEEINNTPLPDNLSGQPTVVKTPKFKENRIKMVGLDSCGHCVETESFINNEVKPNADVPVVYQKISADSDEGQRIVKEKKLTFVPYIEQCLIPVDPNEKPDCKELKDPKKRDIKIKVNE